MKRVLFIINQKSGTDRRKQLGRVIARELDGTRFSSEIVFTGYRGHAVTLAREGVQAGVDIIAAVGGDGSVNEVAQGMEGSDALLAVIPKGSGNGLARTLGIPRDTGRAIRLINRQHTRWIDAGTANGHLFLSNAGVGFDALIARLFARNTGRGLLNYTKLVLHSLGKYQHKHYHLEADGHLLHEKAFFVAVANGTQFGYDFKIAPGALPDDGWLDLCVMHPLRMTNLPHVGLQALTGRLRNNAYIQQLRCRRVRITRDEPLEWMQVDGDALPVENGYVEIGLRPRALRVIVPSPRPPKGGITVKGEG
ncbi:diacylglycerol kinase family protein [Compostibacter hankyongensis]|uniref:Diacylglycerol kinase family lipid kinase n=1 Tax=Compostibacter hankyongensis TaxID=1007089 RepID=A0ABP8FSP3_9BACT